MILRVNDVDFIHTEYQAIIVDLKPDGNYVNMVALSFSSIKICFLFCLVNTSITTTFYGKYSIK